MGSRVAGGNGMTEIQILEASQVQARLQAGEPIDLLDVRTPVEYREVHAVGARLVPLDRLDPVEFLCRPTGRLLAVLCKGGGRARRACETLAALDIPGLVLVEGGTSAWVAAGLPVERGRKAMTLERQVRIAAGALVFTGALLAWLVHPGWLALPAFVGSGLVFAGITDTCGMGMLIARMPWNQVSVEQPAAQCATPKTTAPRDGKS